MRKLIANFFSTRSGFLLESIRLEEALRAIDEEVRSERRGGHASFEFATELSPSQVLERTKRLKLAGEVTCSEREDHEEMSAA